MKIKIIQMVTIVIVALILITGCNGNGVEQPKTEVVPIKTAVVKLENLSIPVHTSGKLYPKAMVKLSFKTGGLIDKIYVDEGDTVKTGQLLAALDLSEINARVNQAKNGFMKAERDLKRVENLYKDRAATLEQLQNVKTAFEVAASDLKIANFNLEHSRIKAPANGKILKRLSEAGEMTGAGSPVFLFGSTEDQWVVKAGVSERDIVRIALKDLASIELDAYPGEQFSAEVTEISDSIDPVAGTYEIETAVNEKGLKLAAGFTAKVKVEPAKKNSYHVIPVDSIVEGEGNEGIVFTVKDNKAVRLKILVAHIFPEMVAVRSGLENVKVVVTSGAAYLTDGIQVKIAAREEK